MQIDDINKNQAMYYVDYLENEWNALFDAGKDTTSSSLNFAIILAAKYPNIQDLIRKELIECYNKGNIRENENEYEIFSINWVEKLQYFRAFIYEVLRVSSITRYLYWYW